MSNALQGPVITSFETIFLAITEIIYDISLNYILSTNSVKVYKQIPGQSSNYRLAGLFSSYPSPVQNFGAPKILCQVYNPGGLQFSTLCAHNHPDANAAPAFGPIR